MTYFARRPSLLIIAQNLANIVMKCAGSLERFNGLLFFWKQYTHRKTAYPATTFAYQGTLHLSVSTHYRVHLSAIRFPVYLQSLLIPAFAHDLSQTKKNGFVPFRS